MVAYRRWNSGATGDDVMVVANFSASARTSYTVNFPKAGTWYVQFNSDWIKYSADYNSAGTRGSVTASGNPVAAKIDIAPYSALIFSQAPPPNPDIDGDNLPDSWETAHGLNPNNPFDAALDPDNDGYTNLEEYQNGTDPQAWDSPVSSFSQMTVAGTFNGWNVASNNMQLIRPGTWCADLTLSSQSNLQFKFVANASWSVSWGDNSQTTFAVPLSDFADLSGANIALNGTLTGIYRFTFVEDTSTFTVQQITTSDADGDGMPDNWEIAYGLNPNNDADASIDTDGDGLTNLQEFRAGTNPRNPNSVFRISSFVNGAGAVTIRFPSVFGKVYRIEYSASLTSGWQTLSDNIPGTGGTIQITDHPPANQLLRFYRADIVP